MTTTKTTLISEELKQLIDEAASSFTNFIKLWSTVKETGVKEGHTEEELQSIISSQIRSALPADLTPQQVKKKIWYVFHSEEHKARTRKNRETGSGGTNIRTPPKKEPEETSNEDYLKGIIARQEDELFELKSKPTEKYEDNAKELFEETLKDRDNMITELRTELAQKTIETIKPAEEPDDYVANLEAEIEDLKKQLQKSRDLTIGSFCPPNSALYKHPKNHWKALKAAVRHVGYDFTIYKDLETGKVVEPQSRGFNIGVTDGEFDGFFGIK